MIHRLTILCFAGLLGAAACAGDGAPPLPEVGEEISFSGPDGTVLRGSLLLPDDDGPFPAVVGLVGSGAYSYRGAWVDGHWPFWKELSDELVAQRIAVLLFDKRGVQLSEGNWKKRTLQQRAEDSLAAVRFLSARPEIDGSRIGLVGQSQGGWVAQIGASQAPDEVAFLITFAGPSIPVLEQVADDKESDLRCEGKSDAVVARKRAKYESRLRRFALGHLSVIKGYDPADDLRRIRQPMLAIFAEHDELVWPGKNERRLREAFEDAGNDRLLTHVVDGTNHAFLYGNRCEPLRGHDGPPAFRTALLDRRFFDWIDVPLVDSAPTRRAVSVDRRGEH